MDAEVKLFLVSVTAVLAALIIWDIVGGAITKALPTVG